MLAEFFELALRIQELRNGPDGRVLEEFAQELCQAGYAEITARRHIRAARTPDSLAWAEKVERLGRWTNERLRSLSII